MNEKTNQCGSDPQERDASCRRQASRHRRESASRSGARWANGPHRETRDQPDLIRIIPKWFNYRRCDKRTYESMTQNTEWSIYGTGSLGLGGLQGAAGQDDAQRRLQTDQTRQANGAASARQQAQLDLCAMHHHQ